MVLVEYTASHSSSLQLEATLDLTRSGELAMTGFNLSPGITPFITDVALIGVVVSLGFAAVLSRKNSFAIYWVLGIDSLAVSLFKVYTDLFDFWDLVLALFVVFESVLLFLACFRGSSFLRLGVRAFSVVLALLSISFSILKISFDFYDPFDVLLSCLGIIAGFSILELPREIRILQSKAI